MNAPITLSRVPDTRVDLLLIADMIPSRSRVLDVGCGEGDLLHVLSTQKDVDARGIEISQAGVNACVTNGLSVIQGDADIDLVDYPDQAFDYVVLSLTLQATRNPRKVVEEMVRIGRHAIVSFPNFAFWKIRLQLLTEGRMPETELLDEPWWETPNIHLCTIRDFEELCRDLNLVVERRVYLNRGGKATWFSTIESLGNLFAQQGLFLLRRA